MSRRPSVDLNALATFALVVEQRSFSAAARHAGVSKSSISKALARLERAVGTRLLNRSTRGLSATEAGEALYGHGQRIIDEALKAEEALARHLAAPHGMLKVLAPVSTAS